MKTFLITLAVLTFIVSTPRAQALFGHVAAERQRRVETEQKLTAEEQHNDHLQTAIHVLSAGVTVALVIGRSRQQNQEGRMKIIVQKPRDDWHREPIGPPTVDPAFQRMNGLPRAAESIRYVLLRWEHWASPSGDIREWLRHNTRIGAWLFIPGIFVMPAVGFILWQVSGWLSTLTSISGHLILVLLALFVVRAVLALFKR